MWCFLNSAKGCPDERYCPQKALHRCNITSADGRVYFATDHGAHQHRSSETCLHTPTEWRRPKEIFPNNSLVEKVGLQFHCAKHPAWLERGDCCKSPSANIPWIGCCHQLAVWLQLCSVCLIGNRQSRHRDDNHSDDWIDALLCEFPATGHLKKLKLFTQKCFNPCCADVLFCDPGRWKVLATLPCQSNHIICLDSPTTSQICLKYDMPSLRWSAGLKLPAACLTR